MIRALYMPRIVSLVTLLFLTVSSLAEEATNTFSGRIVDVKGHPVSELTLITRPTKLINGHAITATDDVTIPFSAFDKSDEAGYFFITYVKPGPVQLELRSPMPGESGESWKSYEILSMKTGTTTFYPTDPSHRGGLKFAIEPDANLEDIVVTVRPRTRYRGQVVFMDGTPLGDTMVDLDVQSKHKKGPISVNRQAVYQEQTDANGYFVQYVDGPDFEIASYTVSVKFQGLTATAEFRLKSGEQREDLVFALEGAPMPIRGQIVFDDGTPLPEARFTLDVKATGDDEERRSHLSGQRETDNAGFFVEYLYQPGSYAVAVEYQGLSATSELVLKAGEQPENLVLTLGGVPMSIRGQIVFDDGTPLPEAWFTLDVKATGDDEEYRSRLSGQRETDNAGFFVEYLYRPGRYAVGVEYQGLSATSELTLKFGEQREDLVFALEGVPMPIRGQIVFDDGTPLPEARFTLDVKATGEDEEHRSHLSGQRETDNAGFFVEYLYQPRSYAVAVEYQGLSATSELTLKFGEQREDLVFTLNGAPIFFDILGVEMMAPTVPNTIGVWIGAPNGSQYKSVRTSSWRDAQTKARTEGAQLVSINDKAEQESLVERFGFLSYWIGLNYSVEAGEWAWSSGEPVTYTNWAKGQPKRMDAESYGFMDGGYHGEWRVVLLGDEILEWRTPIAVILEKK